MRYYVQTPAIPTRTLSQRKPRPRPRAKPKPFASAQHITFGAVEVTRLRWLDDASPIADVTCADGNSRTVRISPEYFKSDISGLLKLAQSAFDRHERPDFLEYDDPEVPEAEIEEADESADSEDAPALPDEPDIALAEDCSGDDALELHAAVTEIVAQREEEAAEEYESELRNLELEGPESHDREVEITDDELVAA